MRKQKQVTSTRVIAFIVKSQANQHTTGGKKRKKGHQKKEKNKLRKKKRKAQDSICKQVSHKMTQNDQQVACFCICLDKKFPCCYCLSQH